MYSKHLTTWAIRHVLTIKNRHASKTNFLCVAAISVEGKVFFFSFKTSRLLPCACVRVCVCVRERERVYVIESDQV